VQPTQQGGLACTPGAVMPTDHLRERGGHYLLAVCRWPFRTPTSGAARDP
jgi:hypothetical protein